jgi:hypothetical protein
LEQEVAGEPLSVSSHSLGENTRRHAVEGSDSVDEALANIREAIALVVEDLKARGEEIPDPHPVSPRLPVISGREAVRAFGQGRHRASRRG